MSVRQSVVQAAIPASTPASVLTVEVRKNIKRALITMPSLSLAHFSLSCHHGIHPVSPHRSTQLAYLNKYGIARSYGPRLCRAIRLASLCPLAPASVRLPLSRPSGRRRGDALDENGNRGRDGWQSKGCTFSFADLSGPRASMPPALSGEQGGE